MKSVDRNILRIAVPSIISNITVPLLSLVDVAIVGHLGSAAYIGAIAVGGMMFNVIYWIFIFLRMGTSGMTSQALGSRRLDETVRLLVRSLTVALCLSLVLLCLQGLILRAALAFMSPTPDVERLASLYFRICIWGAPAILGLYALTGWFIGMQNSRTPMLIAISQNVINIGASLLLVYVGGMKVEGVAVGTVTAQYWGFFLAITMLAWRYGKYLRRNFTRVYLWSRDAMMRFLNVNRDIFLRTVCLVAVMLSFTSAGSWQGETILAVNTMLLQMFVIFSYVMDGFAYAAEAIGGRHFGAGNFGALNVTVRRLFLWGVAMATAFTTVYFLGGDAFLSLLTDDESVIAAAQPYILWATALPLVSFAAFIWDGIFIGCTLTRAMLISMFSAALAFFAAYYGLRGAISNHALWIAFLAYLAVRGLAQTFLFSRVHDPRGLK